MRKSSIFHPLFATHPREGINTSMKDYIEISKPTGNSPSWTPSAGIPAGAYEVVYRGPARVQPNVDWRARDRMHSLEPNASQAVRIQIPIGGNEYGTREDVPVAKDYRVIVVSSEADAAPWLPEYEFIVRNAIQASEKWLFTFLADVGTKIVG